MPDNDNSSDHPNPGHPESYEERLHRLEKHKIAPESENRRSEGHPGAQIAPDIEPSGS